MRTEYTRQTRWAHEPDEVDPLEAPPGCIYLRQVTWVACSDCDLQVHATLSRTIGSGMNCPECGRRLTAPRVLGNPDVAEARIQETEALLASGLSPGEPFEVLT